MVGGRSFVTTSSYFRHSVQSVNCNFPTRTTKRSSLHISPPNQHNNNNTRRSFSRETIYQLRATLRKYLITKPRSLFRKDDIQQLLPLQSKEEESQQHNLESSVQITTAPSLVKNTVTSPKISQGTETMTSDVEVISQSIESFITETAILVTESPLQEVHNAESYEKWALSANDVNLTGLWKINVSEDFKKKYDVYLSRLGQPALVRSIAVGIVDFTSEDIDHIGYNMTIRGKNLRGAWDRTLISSGWDHTTKQVSSDIDNPVQTADIETVQAESWWEDNGTVHVSWMKGVKKYGGGDFESRRYLEQNGEVLVCESIFHQSNDEEGTDNAAITWKFKRDD